MTSSFIILFGLSRSSRRRATVTSSQPEASRAASIASSLVYLPVPRKSRERSWTPATTNGSACVRVCTVVSLPSVPTRRLRRRPPHEWEVKLLELLLHQQLVMAVGQAPDGTRDGKPHHPVDLDPRLEPPAAHFHDPVAGDLVATPAVDVGRAAERPQKPAPQAGLLPDLAQRAVLGRFVGFDLALR